MGKGGGGFLDTAISVVSDIVATVTGNPELIPLINAGESGIEGLAKGESFGKALGQGALSGGEALAGQEVAGAFGVGSGNSVFNNALGITGDNPAGTGLPDIGGAISNATSGANNFISNLFSGTTPTPDAAAAVGGAPGSVANAGATAGLNSGAAGSGGAPVGAPGVSAAGSAAPSSLPIDTSSLNTNYDPANASFGNIQPGGQNGLNNILTQASGNTPTGGTTAGGTTAGGTPTGSGTGYTGLNLSALGGGAGGATGTGNAVNFGDSALGGYTTTASNIGSGAPSGGAVGGAAPAGNSGVNFVKSLFDGQTGTSGGAFTDFLGKNASLLPAAGALGYEAIAGNKLPKGTNELEGEAAQLNAQGAQLENYINTGTLPPGLEGAVAQNLAATQASIRSQYAARGMSGSSAEQQDLQNAAIQSQAQTAQLATGLLSEGVAETGDAAGIYNNLIADIQKSDQGLQSALAAFAAASEGQGIGGTGLKVSIGPNGQVTAN